MTNTTPQPFIGGMIAGTLIKGVAGAILKETIKTVLERDDVPVPSRKVPETTERIVVAINEDIAEKKIAIVPVKSRRMSKINWVAFAAPLASLFAVFGLDLSAEQIVAVVLTIQAIQSVVTWVLRSFFNNYATG